MLGHKSKGEDERDDGEGHVRPRRKPWEPLPGLHTRLASALRLPLRCCCGACSGSGEPTEFPGDFLSGPSRLFLTGLLSTRGRHGTPRGRARASLPVGARSRWRVPLGSSARLLGGPHTRRRSRCCGIARCLRSAIHQPEGCARTPCPVFTLGELNIISAKPTLLKWPRYNLRQRLRFTIILQV